jgi:hypothetical protein
MSILKDISDHKDDFNMSQTEEKNEMTSNRGLLLLGPGGSPPEPVFQDILSKVKSMHNLIQNLYRVYEIDIDNLNTVTSIDPSISPAADIASFDKDKKDEDAVLGVWTIDEKHGFGLNDHDKNDDADDDANDDADDDEDGNQGGGGRRRRSRKHIRRSRRRHTRKNI